MEKELCKIYKIYLDILKKYKNGENGFIYNTLNNKSTIARLSFIKANIREVISNEKSLKYLMLIIQTINNILDDNDITKTYMYHMSSSNTQKVKIGIDENKCDQFIHVHNQHLSSAYLMIPIIKKYLNDFKALIFSKRHAIFTLNVYNTYRKLFPGRHIGNNIKYQYIQKYYNSSLIISHIQDEINKSSYRCKDINLIIQNRGPKYPICKFCNQKLYDNCTYYNGQCSTKKESAENIIDLLLKINGTTDTINSINELSKCSLETPIQIERVFGLILKSIRDDKFNIKIESYVNRTNNVHIFSYEGFVYMFNTLL